MHQTHSFSFWTTPVKNEFAMRIGILALDIAAVAINITTSRGIWPYLFVPMGLIWAYFLVNDIRAAFRKREARIELDDARLRYYSAKDRLDIDRALTEIQKLTMTTEDGQPKSFQVWFGEFDEPLDFDDKVDNYGNLIRLIECETELRFVDLNASQNRPVDESSLFLARQAKREQQGVE